MNDIMIMKKSSKPSQGFIKNKTVLICPDEVEISELVSLMQQLLFPEFFLCCEDDKVTCEKKIEELEIVLERILGKLVIDVPIHKKNDIIERIIENLPELQRISMTDVEAAYLGNPAAKSYEEIIFCYPGLMATMIYRIAHFFYTLKITLLPRILSEYAHSKTGIDIHPGATIGEYFFIDHGTGVVIGETTVIGSHVKLYQGVTLGAISTAGGQLLSGKKRHPTLMDNVTVYAGATILGGETVIEKGRTIKGNDFIYMGKQRSKNGTE